MVSFPKGEGKVGGGMVVREGEGERRCGCGLR